jgi:hypothetical protein
MEYEWLWFNEEWDVPVVMDGPQQWNRFDFAFVRWDHATIFTNLVRSLLDISRAHRVPSTIFGNFYRCIGSSGSGRHTDRVTPLMVGQTPHSFLLSNSVGTVGGVPNHRICILSACLGTPIYFDA